MVLLNLIPTRLKYTDRSHSHNILRFNSCTNRSVCVNAAENPSWQPVIIVLNMNSAYHLISFPLVKIKGKDETHPSPVIRNYAAVKKKLIPIVLRKLRPFYHSIYLSLWDWSKYVKILDIRCRLRVPVLHALYQRMRPHQVMPPLPFSIEFPAALIQYEVERYICG